MNKPFFVRLPVDLIDRFKKFCEEKGTLMQFAVKQAITEWLERKEK